MFVSCTVSLEDGQGRTFHDASEAIGFIEHVSEFIMFHAKLEVQMQEELCSFWFSSKDMLLDSLMSS